ncbi:AHH domain-containing protein [Thalassolituus marinus]|uniref:AHH domain-containing protein n=1 Tax=Thalassolituus marinus TaxID=671053 RepID=A0ABS7ZPQ0_9GAMM|nr:AHH domain-containing protein [Thalassolituus marinus]MCA6063655.1 AHH domain-containing protein [Thalassolituus marinus]
MDPLYLEVDELDFRLGLTELLTVSGRLTKETNQLIAKTITDTKVLAMKEVLAQYIKNGQGMSHTELMSEQHDSTRLGDFLGAVGYERPVCGNFEAHAIVSGGHIRAEAAREILAQYNVRIDDPCNGVWLPNYKRNLPNYPDFAFAHRTVHRKTYYLNITSCLEQAMSPMHARAILRRIARGVVSGNFSLDRRLKRSEIMEISNGSF